MPGAAACCMRCLLVSCYDSESAYRAWTTCRHAVATRLDTKNMNENKGVVLYVVSRLSEISKRMRVSHKRSRCPHSGMLQPKYRKRGYELEGYQGFLGSERCIVL